MSYVNTVSGASAIVKYRSGSGMSKSDHGIRQANYTIAGAQVPGRS